MITRFAAPEAIGDMDCPYAYWATDKRGGFNDAHVEATAGLMPMLAVAMKCISLARIAETLVETYLGRDPVRRVLNGLIRRGVADRINAVSGTVICGTSLACRSRWRRNRSFRCWTIMRKWQFPRFMRMAAMSSS